MSSPNLRFYLDTADTDQWRTWLRTGLFYGVTTNPLLLERAQVACTVTSLQHLARTALDLGAREVQLQTWGATVEALVHTGKLLAAIAPEVVVKVPITEMGVEAAGQLLVSGHRVTLTAVYAPHQVLIAAALGVQYAAPYLGRITDMGRDGLADLAQMQRAIAHVQSDTRLLVASIRQVEDMIVLATEGLDTFTFSPEIACDLFAVPPTHQATLDFEHAAERMGATT
jgi:transaldolase